MPRLGLNEIYSPSGPLSLSPAADEDVDVTGRLDLTGIGINRRLIEFPVTGGNAPAGILMGEFANAVGTRPNNVIRIGHNIDIGGGRIDPTKHALADEWEAYYRPAENQRWAERHMVLITEAGVPLRFLSMEGDVDRTDGLDNKVLRLRLAADILNIQNPEANEEWVVIQTNGMTFTKAAFSLSKTPRGDPFLRQGGINVAHLTAAAVDTDYPAGRVRIGDYERPAQVPGGLEIGGRDAPPYADLLITAAAEGPVRSMRLVNYGDAALGAGVAIHAEVAGGTKLGRFGVARDGSNRGALFHDVWDGSAYVRTFAARGDGDVELMYAAAGVILKSPDGTPYRITVPNGGAALTITPV